MKKQEHNVRYFSRIYERTKKWLIVADILFLVIVFYLGDLLNLGALRDQLLVAAAIGILAILFEILMFISENMKPKPEVTFSSLYEALPKINEMVEDDKEITSIKIIAATGGTTVSSILPSIVKNSQAKKLEISMGVIDPDTPYREWLPSRWPAEVRTSIKRLADEFESERISVDIFYFRVLPVTHGLLINDKHLFLGFFGWTESNNRPLLAGAQLPHRYYNASEPDSKYQFDLFRSWFEHCPRKTYNRRLFVFDFDGTLVDSYKCLPDVYASIARKLGIAEDNIGRFVADMINNEDERDSMKDYDRYKWWPAVLDRYNIKIPAKELERLISTYWDERTRKTAVVEYARGTLESLRKRNNLALVSATDGKSGNKKKRIRRSGLQDLFEDVIVVGEDVESHTEALELLIKRYGLTENLVVYVDDKCSAINEISRNLKDVITVRVGFEGILKLAWSDECTPVRRIETIGEAAQI